MKHAHECCDHDHSSKKHDALDHGHDHSHDHSHGVSNRQLFLVVLSGCTCGFGLLAKLFSLHPFILDLFFVISILSGGMLVFPNALRSLRKFSIDMNVLMTVAVLGAFAIGDHAEASAVVFLFSLAEFLESLSVMRARRAIEDVLDIAPKVMKVKLDGAWIERAINLVNVGDVVQVLAGDRIGLDGVVISGEASVNQAPITGESLPVEKTVNAEIFAGSICENGALTFRVTKKQQDTRLAKIIELVEKAQSVKAPSQRFVDRFARIYTPLVMSAAILLYLIPVLLMGGESAVWIYRALVLLVIACPCALVISTPIAIISSLTALARNGVLIKGGTFLESLGKIKALAFDKTGTITKGKPLVQRVIPWNEHRTQEILETAASIESKSNHPLARAVVAYAAENHIQSKEVSHMRVVGGRGIEAKVAGHDFFLGNHKFAHDEGVCSAELEKTLSELESEAFSVIVVGHKNHHQCTGQTMGVIALGDQLREEVKESMLELRRSGVDNMMILSGDNQKTVNVIAKQAGVEEAFGDLLPEDKVLLVKKMVATHGQMAMVGDGINDAPALAASTVGIAMGGGTDTALETADVVLMRDDLSMLASAIRHAGRTVAVVRFNIFFALLTKIGFLILAVMGFSNMWLAVAADMGASLLVAANSLRLLKVKGRG